MYSVHIHMDAFVGIVPTMMQLWPVQNRAIQEQLKHALTRSSRDDDNMTKRRQVSLQVPKTSDL
jgi:hypothetical protein